MATEPEAVRKVTAQGHGPILGDSTGRYSLVTVPWDSHCEMVKWALDRHGANYEELDVPWGLHLWVTLGFSKPLPDEQQTRVPVLMNHKNEIFRTPTEILMYLYSQAWSGRIRLYSKVEALDLQEHFDGEFAAAAKTVFLHTLLSRRELANQYLRDQTHLNYWIVLSQFLWPVISWSMWLSYDLGKTGCMEAAWATVEAGFRRAEKELATHLPDGAAGLSRINKDSGVASPSTFLTGPSITAADISFASHASLALFLNDDDDDLELESTNLGISMPSIKALPPAVAERVKALRASPAGQYAIHLFRKERGTRIGHKPSKHARVNNPDWATHHNLKVTAINCTMLTLLVFSVPCGILPFPFAMATWAVYLLAAYLVFYRPNQNSILMQRVRQVWHVQFGKQSSPAPSKPADASGKAAKVSETTKSK
ncbi:hypothetical protein BC831DRAFT_465385 [Entophlyctis helioformis]|nr:hypothetical protein BC831DRAFT_465385 [Entophlyctis helioformis]